MFVIVTIQGEVAIIKLNEIFEYQRCMILLNNEGEYRRFLLISRKHIRKNISPPTSEIIYLKAKMLWL